VGRTRGRGGAALSPSSTARRLSGVLLGLAFYGGPVALVALAVSARTAGYVDSREVVESRLREHMGPARSAAREEDVPLPLLLAVAAVESAGRADARSGAGAVGLLQLLPTTAAEISRGGPPPKLTDPAVSLRLGARYLRMQLDRFAGNPTPLELALCAYNAGPGAVQRWIDEEGAPEDR